MFGKLALCLIPTGLGDEFEFCGFLVGFAKIVVGLGGIEKVGSKVRIPDGFFPRDVSAIPLKFVLVTETGFMSTNRYFVFRSPTPK
jgi:hypothetical protein